MIDLDAIDRDEPVVDDDLPAEGEDTNTQDDDAGDGLVITYGDEEEEEVDPLSESATFQELRKQYRAVSRELAEEKARRSAPAAIEIGDKPTLLGCDYDEERFETELDAWKSRKNQAEEVQTQHQKSQEAVQAKWTQQLKTFEKQGVELGASDYKDALDTVTSSLSLMQQAALVKAAKNGALVTYALYKSPQRLEAIKALDDPIELAVAVAELERGLKMTTRRRAPDPETTVRGSAPISRGSNAAEKEYQRLSETVEDRGKLREFREKHSLDVHGKHVKR